MRIARAALFTVQFQASYHLMVDCHILSLKYIYIGLYLTLKDYQLFIYIKGMFSLFMKLNPATQGVAIGTKPAKCFDFRMHTYIMSSEVISFCCRIMTLKALVP